MNIVTVASIIVLFTIVVGVLLALVFVNASNMVSTNQSTLDKEKTGYNARTTAGHKIMVQASPEAQIKQAQGVAAQRAAALPRGANMGIKVRTESDAKLRTASEGLENDPVTATKIAAFHTWNGLQYKSGKAAPVSASAAPTAKPATSAQARPAPAYQEIAITDSMTPEEKRKAVIANSKAKAAAMKAAKASGAGPEMGEAVTAGEAAPLAAAPSAVAAPVAVGGSVEPVAGVHYEEIAITEGMSPEEIRKARIANSKAKAAAAKNLKASGATMAVATPVAEAPIAAAPVAVSPVATATAAIPKPDLIDITAALSPDETRKARIENSKRMSAYNKALKAAGIDPATMN